MTKVVGVRFKDTGKTYYFDPKGLEIKKGDLVVVETARGMECGVAQYAPKEVAENEVTAPLKPVLRIATARDKQILEENKEKEKRAYEVCLQKIEKHKLDMNLTEVEYAFDGSKILFYFTASGIQERVPRQNVHCPGGPRGSGLILNERGAKKCVPDPN
jgi:cell fate regulator YaaT (PSP1 superfamily)